MRRRNGQTRQARKCLTTSGNHVARTEVSPVAASRVTKHRAPTYCTDHLKSTKQSKARFNICNCRDFLSDAPGAEMSHDIRQPHSPTGVFVFPVAASRVTERRAPTYGCAHSKSTKQSTARFNIFNSRDCLPCVFARLLT